MISENKKCLYCVHEKSEVRTVKIRRFLCVFYVFLFAFSIIGMRLFVLASNTEYKKAAYNQQSRYVELENGRGNFYDCNFIQLTSSTYNKVGLIAPTQESYRTLFSSIQETDKEEFYQSIQKSVPFLLELPYNTNFESYTFLQTQRYLTQPIANQLIGYIDEEGNGVAGLEKAFDEVLQGGANEKQIYSALSATGEFISTVEPYVAYEGGTNTGVMLTIDAAIQRICESIALQHMDKGAIVVMDTETGEIKAAVSMPQYNPSNVYESLNSEDSPFLNRVISSYNVGSVFKPLIAAVAIESGYDISEEYYCTGSINVAGHTYRCAHGIGHGETTLEHALSVSCNTYFVNLGLQLSPKLIEKYMQNIGFGESTLIANSLQTARGNIPTAAELENLGARASISFGQGTLTASPLQVTAFFNAIANGGIYISPTFVKGYVDEIDLELTESLYNPVIREWIDESTAVLLQDMLINAVETGLGQSAKPTVGGSGGKTGTAQTGRYLEDGIEITEAWFAGFYPASEPQYTITVLLDSSNKSSEQASLIYKEIANALSFLA